MPGTRVWILTYMDPSKGSGVERFVSSLSIALSKTGFEVAVIDAIEEPQEESVLSRIRPLAAWRLGRILNKRAEPQDVVVCNGYFSWNARAGRRVVVLHGTELGRARATVEVTSRLRNLAVRAVNARLDKRAGTGSTVVAVSQGTKDELERLYGLKVDRVIPNGIRLDIFAPSREKSHIRKSLGLPEGEFLILYAGPPDRRKGFRFLLDEVQPRLKQGQSLVVTVKLASPPGNVIAVGRVNPEEMVKYYQACDAFVMPSYYEGCSYALAEALACGLPSVVSSAGDAKEMSSDDVLGRFVVHGMNAEEYVKRITELQDSTQERVAVSEASRRFAEAHYDISDFERKYTDLIQIVARQGN